MSGTYKLAEQIRQSMQPSVIWGKAWLSSYGSTYFLWFLCFFLTLTSLLCTYSSDKCKKHISVSSIEGWSLYHGILKNGMTNTRLHQIDFILMTMTETFHPIVTSSAEHLPTTYITPSALWYAFSNSRVLLSMDRLRLWSYPTGYKINVWYQTHR